jgi:pyruvate dehydrogenase E2 component (dihydrolipoamide acetyltransferase)
LGVELSQVAGTGPRQRILSSDVERHAQSLARGARTSEVAREAPMTGVTSSGEFGEVELRPLSRTRRTSANRLAASAATIPHVTGFDRADITDLEEFRRAHNDTSPQKLTMLPFVLKACGCALRAFPALNASLLEDGLLLKRYVHVGFAVETGEGLVVPVIRDLDRLSIREIAAQVTTLAAKARERRLTPGEQSGGCFTVSSLGGIGGTAFTPIINPPELAILGVSRHALEPRWDGVAFRPRLVLPLSLSYDHRAVDGAAGTRFLAYIAELLTDLRRALL